MRTDKEKLQFVLYIEFIKYKNEYFSTVKTDIIKEKVFYYCNKY